jgi:Arm DNA-binding domain
MTKRDRLADATVRAAVRKGEPRWLPDGAGLYLHVVSKTAASWVYRYALNGQTRYAGLGSAVDMTLAQVREEHGRLRALKRTGVDPLAELREERAEQARIRKEKETPKHTVQEVVTAFRAAKVSAWSEAWTYRFDIIVKHHILPSLGDRPVAAVITADVQAALNKIWKTKLPTALHARRIVEQILAFATAQEWRTGPNPAAWRNNLKDLLSTPNHHVKNHPALPYIEVHVFMAALRAIDTVAARALEFAILTGGRAREILGARWSEIDLEQKL